MSITRTVQKLERQQLEEGRCPDHGIRMTQVAQQYLEEADQFKPIFACPRRNCTIRAQAQTIHGPWMLLSE